MAMDITCTVVTIPVGANYCLMSREALTGKFHSELLSPFGSQSVFVTIFRIEAHDIVMSLDFFVSFIASKGIIGSLAFSLEREGIAVDSFNEIEVTRDHFTIRPEDRFVGELVVLHRQIIGRCVVVRVTNREMFHCCHDTHLPIFLRYL